MRLWFVSRLVSRTSVRRSGVRNGHAVAPSVGQRRHCPKTRKRQLRFLIARHLFSRNWRSFIFCFLIYPYLISRCNCLSIQTTSLTSASAPKANRSTTAMSSTNNLESCHSQIPWVFLFCFGFLVLVSF
jgi:hypothetical protein